MKTILDDEEFMCRECGKEFYNCECGKMIHNKLTWVPRDDSILFIFNEKEIKIS